MSSSVGLIPASTVGSISLSSSIRTLSSSRDSSTGSISKFSISKSSSFFSILGITGFIKGANRFEIGYGKKREGIFCVGGVCKLVPSSNGFNLSVSSSF